MTNRRRVEVGAAVLVAVAIGGTIAYALTEDLSVLESVYLVLITLSTVGFSEPAGGFSAGGQVVTMVVIVIGVAAAFYTVTGVLELIFDSLARGRRRRLRELKMIKGLSGHVIVCGYGRVGRRVHELLVAQGTETVIIEEEEDQAEDARRRGAVVVNGDAGRDEYLDQAGIDDADTIVACVGSEAANLAIVLSARSRRPTMYILARGGDRESQRKLRLAGADRVVAPESAGAERLARLVDHRELTEFVDVASEGALFEFQVEELTIAETSALAGRTVGDARVLATTGALILAVQHGRGVVSAPATGATEMGAGDILISIGTPTQLGHLRKAAGP